MSDIEETLERIKTASGVEGFVVVDGKGNILRQHADMTKEKALQFAKLVGLIASKARHVVRDLDPENDLQYLRVRAQHEEILVAPGRDFLVVVIQRWEPASSV